MKKEIENPAAAEKEQKTLPRQERFSPGWTYQPGLKILHRIAVSQPRGRFSPGWSYQPGLKILCPHRCAAATWNTFCPGWEPNRD